MPVDDRLTQGGVMGHRAVLTVATAAVLVASAVAAAAHEPSDESRPGSTVVAAFHDPGALGFTHPQPDCPDAARGGCAFAFDGTTTETGDVAGSTTYHGWLFPGDAVGQALRWEVDETFTGTVAGCGRGTVRWTGSGYGDVTSFDAASQSARMWGTLKIVDGSGTGGLRRLSGQLAVEARARAVPPAAQEGTLKGPLTCHG